MAETDNPLKRLVETAISDFAAWLLGVEVQDAYAVNIELTSDLVRVDQLFRVTLQNGQTTLLHIEFQGRSTHRPMKWRMLEYMSRIADAEPELALFSVVFYVGAGAGNTDTGEHKVNSPGDTASIHWKYRVVHVWKMQATELLKLQRPGLLPLLGQTKIDNPAVVIPQVIDTLTQLENEDLKRGLFTSLMTLVENEEIATMIEKLIEHEDLLMDTPFLRRLRQEALEKGLEEGRDEGMRVGLAQGALLMRRQDILDALILRFDPAASIYRELEKMLADIDDEAELERLFAAAIRAANLADFQAALQPAAPPE